MIAVVLLLVNIDIWCKLTFPEWKHFYALPTFSMLGLIETEIFILFAFRLDVAQQEGTGNVIVLLWNSDGEKVTHPLQSVEKQFDLMKFFRVLR